MYIKKIKLSEDIYLVHFKTQDDMASTFLRFQEHYESPKFMNKIFTLREFKQWYVTQKNGKFSYYKDWDGFNIPSRIFNLFRDGKFDPLSAKEKALLKLFEKETHDFYIVSVSGKAHHHVLKHEIAHGLFFTHPKYKKEVLSIMKKYNLHLVKKELLSMGGYNKKVLLDEIQAYSVSLYPEIKAEFPEKMRAQILKAFDKYSPIVK
jgi:hypothetical protein